VTHDNGTRLFDATKGWFGFDASDTWTLFHSPAFDFSVWEIWGALFYGGRLVVVPHDVSRAADAFHNLLVKERVTVLNQTPSAFRQLMVVDESATGAAELALRYVIFGGEALDLQSLGPWFSRHGDERPRLVNMYGITETTVHVTYRPISSEDVRRRMGSVIGEPIPDLRLYVLDAHRQLVPVGVPGELFVGGSGVARGYLSRPELTAERFVEDPFAVVPGARLYRTGDVARRLADGDLEYLGRVDHQVKIRGFRIELGEIEAHLAAVPEISQAVVAARETARGDRVLVAYMTSRSESRPHTSELRRMLGARLPDYMVPAAFVWLDAMPLAPSGKVDRKALPAPGEAGLQDAAAAELPATATEQLIADVWTQVLGRDNLGLDESFFEIGGDSVSIVDVHRRLRERVTGKLTITELFQYPTVRALASHLAAGADAAPADDLQARAARQREAQARRRRPQTT
jgi:acyl-coenzyme A synthetase/AMP-(fatty) acid ligase/acyl carrier protein